MKWIFSMFFLAIITVGNTRPILAQDQPRAGSDAESLDKAILAAQKLGSLIDEIFAPVTEKLNLTQEQQFQIIAIIIDTDLRAGPLFESLKGFEQMLSELSLSEVPDENRLKEISDQEGAVLSELVRMKVRAKSGIYQLLTMKQRAIVAQQFRLKNQPEGRLGSITIY